MVAFGLAAAVVATNLTPVPVSAKKPVCSTDYSNPKNWNVRHTAVSYTHLHAPHVGLLIALVWIKTYSPSLLDVYKRQDASQSLLILELFTL